MNAATLTFKKVKAALILEIPVNPQGRWSTNDEDMNAEGYGRFEADARDVIVRTGDPGWYWLETELGDERITILATPAHSNSEPVKFHYRVTR